MHITSAVHQSIEIKASYLAAAQSVTASTRTGLSEFLAESASFPVRKEAVAHLRIAKANVSVYVGSKLTADFKRSTKKSPPTQTRILVLCSSKADFDASTHGDPVFENVIPKKQGRVFIGFPTHQTTGFGGHVSAPALVPTVERESIDLADPQMRIWNSELLSCVGIFARFKPRFEGSNVKVHVRSRNRNYWPGF